MAIVALANDAADAALESECEPRSYFAASNLHPPSNLRSPQRPLGDFSDRDVSWNVVGWRLVEFRRNLFLGGRTELRSRGRRLVRLEGRPFRCRQKSRQIFAANDTRKAVERIL